MLNNSYIQHIKMDESIDVDIYSNIAYYNYNANKDNINKVIKTPIQNYLLSTGSLLLDPEAFNGFIFIDKYWNIYDTINKRIKFNWGNKFIGDPDKSAFYLFEGFEEIEKDFKKCVDELKSISDKNQKNVIKNFFIKDLKDKFENFNIEKVILKNGKYYINNNYYNIHENFLEYFENNNKIFQSDDFFQEINSQNQIIIQMYGTLRFFTPNDYEGEYFYNLLIGKGKLNERINNKNEIKEKFYFFDSKKKLNLQKIKEDDDYLFYVDDKRITLEKNRKNKDGFVVILVKDRYNKTVIYEIKAKLEKDNSKLIGSGIVDDKRRGELLLVNFDNNNIISNNYLDIMPIFVDRDEFNLYKKSKQEPPKKKKIYADIKNDFIKPNKLKNEIEKITDKMKEKITKKNIERLGIKNQQFAGECWLYSICQIIQYSNSRILGRKLEDFESIYNKIANLFSKKGKTNENMEIIMDKIFPKYGLYYERQQNKNIYELREIFKKGIKCLLTFNWNNKQWHNFSDYYQDKSIEQENKLLTLDILNKPIYENIIEPDNREGHSVILFDIDYDDNYIIVNSWGEEWGNKGTFKAKKECFQDTQAIYSVYWREDELTPEEKQAWNDFPEVIINLLNEMKTIRCPICKRCARIEQYDIIDYNQKKLKCPFQNGCEFEINYDNDNYEFILEQLLAYDLYTEKDLYKKFDPVFNPKLRNKCIIQEEEENFF